MAKEAPLAQKRLLLCGGMKTQGRRHWYLNVNDTIKLCERRLIQPNWRLLLPLVQDPQPSFSAPTRVFVSPNDSADIQPVWSLSPSLLAAACDDVIVISHTRLHNFTEQPHYSPKFSAPTLFSHVATFVPQMQAFRKLNQVKDMLPLVLHGAC